MKAESKSKSLAKLQLDNIHKVCENVSQQLQKVLDFYVTNEETKTKYYEEAGPRRLQRIITSDKNQYVGLTDSTQSRITQLQKDVQLFVTHYFIAIKKEYDPSFQLQLLVKLLDLETIDIDISDIQMDIDNIKERMERDAANMERDAANRLIHFSQQTPDSIWTKALEEAGFNHNTRTKIVADMMDYWQIPTAKEVWLRNATFEVEAEVLTDVTAVVNTVDKGSVP